MKELGSIEAFNLGELSDLFEGYEAGIRHLGFGKVRQWHTNFRRLRQLELERIYTKRKELTERGLAADFPEWFEVQPDKTEDGEDNATAGMPMISTPEGDQAADQATKDILTEALAYIKRPDGEAYADPVATAFQFGLAQVLVEPVMSAQAPTEPEVFS